MADTTNETITIRRAVGADREALRRLAELDSKHLPSDEFLIADVGGEPGAAVGIRTGTVVADPFRRTAAAVDLLRIRARRLRCSDSTAATPPRPLHRLIAPARSGCQ